MTMREAIIKDLLSFPTLAAISVILLSLFLWIRSQKNSPNHTSKGKLAPEPAGALPLLGHLHLLGAQAPLAHTLASFADKYGPIFTIRLGAFPALVVSSQDAIKECFTTNDKILACRPKSSQGIYLNYNYASFGSAPDGPYWRKLRKLVMLELLSARRVESLKYVYESEIDVFIGDLYSYGDGDNNNKRKVVISEWLERLTLNIITRMIAGKRYFGNSQDVDDEEARRVVKLIKDFMHISGEFVPSDLIPFLRWFPGEGKVLRSMKKMASDLDSLASSWVEEHRVKKKESNSEKQDFIDFMLSVIEEDDSTLGHTRDAIIKANILSLILAGADTTSINLTWMLALLLNNKHVLKRAQEEIDHHVGKQRWVQTSDTKNLTYLEAIFKETLRLYPAGPLLIPHEATQDCYISGYYVPKGTRVLANVWKLHRDPTIWSQSEKFMPERFITENNNNGEIDHGEGYAHFQYLPFGSGRRACPGSNLAAQVSVLTLARLLQGFELEVYEKVDMKEGTSITLPKATPLQVILTPRLSPRLYHLLYTS
ncbi:cytochrome P450 CYP82D47 [Neltuma alba]|uniref:cytochrome P450 CYP82D47 n=1 Tax=Neltuma alba TaxID=207710 RepID=UPI0010A53DFE|nr:cytochrome P450 CYP82D47-like [Prosopis alba]XP_028776908.1 cytochrome P450 CYP82D47-like [Prosopis alba]